MINIKTLTEEDRGKRVVYHLPGSDKVEGGVISSWNEKFIFVRYNESKIAAATYSGNLEFEDRLSRKFRNRKRRIV